MNNGKRLEQNFRKSVPNDVFYYRLKDSAVSFGGNNNVRFTPSNICDCLLFDGNRLYLLELKSTKGKSIPFSNFRENQLKELSTAQRFKNTVSGIVIEFSELDRAFFIEIEKVVEFIRKSERKSIPLDYFIDNGIEIETTKKRVNNSFNIKRLLTEVI